MLQVLSAEKRGVEKVSVKIISFKVSFFRFMETKIREKWAKVKTYVK